jgi:hypothetical protein
MDLEKYKNDGWGLSKPQLEQLLKVINKFEKETVRVLEFGSGKSTEFLGDITTNGIKNLDITTFDDNPNFSYNGNHNNVNIKFRDLVECSDYNYNEMFINKKFNKSCMLKKTTPLSTRQKNNFYEILDGDLNGYYDVIILDGPNGNGRNISYLHIINHVYDGSIMLIDDINDYDFMEKLSLLFDYEILYKNKTGKINQWLNGGDYSIVKITKINN